MSREGEPCRLLRLAETGRDGDRNPETAYSLRPPLLEAPSSAARLGAPAWPPAPRRAQHRTRSGRRDSARRSPATSAALQETRQQVLAFRRARSVSGKAFVFHSCVGRAPATLLLLDRGCDLVGDDPQLGVRAAHPLALGPLEAWSESSKLWLPTKNGRSLDVLIEFNGQANLNDPDEPYGGTIRVKFDNKPPVTWRFGVHAGRTGWILFRNQTQLVQRLSKTQWFTVDLDYFGHGSEVFSFRTEGLDITRLGLAGKKKQ